MYKLGILNLLAFFGVFLMTRIIDICDIPLRGHFVSYDNNPSRYAITCIFQPCVDTYYLKSLTLLRRQTLLYNGTPDAITEYNNTIIILFIS